MLRTKTFQDFDPWTANAACRGLRADSGFYPYLNDRYDYVWDPAPIAFAKETCSVCPIRSVCLDYAVSGREDEGIWGGLLPEERRTVRSSWAKSAPSFLAAMRQEIQAVTEKYVMAGDLIAA